MKKILTLLLISISINSVAQIPLNGLMGYWPFSGNADDLSGNNNNGNVIGATLTTDRFGNMNKAYSFNGVNNQINIPSTSSISNFPNGQTLSFWMKISNYPTDNKEHYMIDKSDNYSLPTVKFYQVCISDFGNTDSLLYRYAESASSNSQGSFLPFSSFPLNQWVHLCYTTDLTITKTYLNGLLFSTYNLYSPIGVTNNPLIFGNRTGVSSNHSPFMGNLDDIRIYDRPLNAVEVSSLYNEIVCTQFVTVTDTNYVTVVDTNYVTINDTNYVTIIDTNFVTINDTNYVTITDTSYISVTDTLIINALLTGIAPPNNNNTIKVFPNPASTHITIDYGSYSLMVGYTLKITNNLGQTMFINPISQPQSYIDLSSWNGNGIYFIHVIDNLNNTIDIRKIVLQ